MVSEETSLAETQRLGKELLTSRSNVNYAPLLLSILSANSDSGATSIPSSTQCRLEALHALQAFFIQHIRSGIFFTAARKKAKLDLEAAGGPDEANEKQKDGGRDVSRHAEAVYRLWVWNKYLEFQKSLFRIVSQPVNAQVLQVSAINTLMDLVRDGRPGEFNNSLYLKICSRMVDSKGQNNELFQVLMAKYFKYNDVRYFTYRNLQKLLEKRLLTQEIDHGIVSSDDDENNQKLDGVSLNTFVRNVYDVLSHLPTSVNEEKKDGDVVDEDWSHHHGGENVKTLKKEGMEKKNKKQKDITSATHDNSQSYSDTRKLKSIISKAWLSFLQLSLPLDIYKKVLSKLHQNVIPFMTNPLLLGDFLTQSYNIGGLISVMALSSLFVLITKYGLEYPDFYNKLYALLEPSIFVARYRSRFFELLDTCLKSSHLPGYLGAAFAKRLARLVLSAPPSGAIVVVALIHNLLRRHPSINVLVHRVDNSLISIVDTPSNIDEGAQSRISNFEEQGILCRTSKDIKLGRDPFIATEADTAKCNALQSCLWEIETLRRHYCPAVSRFVESLETDLTVRVKTTEVAIADFSSASYATIFGEEVGRRLKSVPLAFYGTVPSSLFPESDFDGSFTGWRFGESADLGLRSLEESKLDGDGYTGNLEVDDGIEEDQDEDSARRCPSDEEFSSDGSRGSRSRSEQSDGQDWSMPLLKRIRNF